MSYKSSEERAAAPCYVARHSCGKIVAAMVADDPKRAKNVAKEVAKWIRSGDTVERITAAEVRADEWCSCFDKPKRRADPQASLSL